jgi:hypothetical protein
MVINSLSAITVATVGDTDDAPATSRKVTGVVTGERRKIKGGEE